MTVQVTENEPRSDRRRLPSRKVVPLPIGGLAAPDAIEAWASRYLDAAVRGVRSAEVADKIALHLARFRDHFHAAHGHDRLSVIVQREVIAWRNPSPPTGPPADWAWPRPQSTPTSPSSPGSPPGYAPTTRPPCHTATRPPRPATCHCPRSNPAP